MGVGEGEAGDLETLGDHVLPPAHGVPAAGQRPLDQLQAEQAKPGHLQDGVRGQSRSSARDCNILIF